MNHIKLAFSQYGIKEIAGSVDNPEIVKYFDDLGFDGTKLKDETAWCSAFANWVCMNSDLEYTKKLNARSWLKVGRDTTNPVLGDIVVLWREHPDSWKGHVGFYINDDDKYIYILGGNQSNQVCIKPYPKTRLLTFKRLS
jgi:uncharacterized protein (TIGR02594 family)